MSTYILQIIYCLFLLFIFIGRVEQRLTKSEVAQNNENHETVLNTRRISLTIA
jgi:hypothetical protein